MKLKLFYVDYTWKGIFHDEYVVCPTENDIAGVLQQRWDNSPPVKITEVVETNLQTVKVQDLTVGDLLKLIQEVVS